MLFVVRRWTATAVSYQAVLSPPITILLSALLLREPIGWRWLWAPPSCSSASTWVHSRPSTAERPSWGPALTRSCRARRRGLALQPESDRSRSSLLPRRPSVTERNNPTCVRSQQARGGRSVLVPSEWQLHSGPLLCAGLPLLSSCRGYSQLGGWASWQKQSIAARVWKRLAFGGDCVIGVAFAAMLLSGGMMQLIGAIGPRNPGDLQSPLAGVGAVVGAVLAVPHRRSARVAAAREALHA